MFDLGGRLVRTLIAGQQQAGPHSMVWDGRDDGGRPVASGPYFLRLSQGGQKSTQAVVRVR